MIAASYPFLDVIWTMFIFFLWITWLVLLFRVFADIFRRDDLSGLGKTAWLIVTILLPYLGVFIYVITQNDGMTQRTIDRARAKHANYDDYLRTGAGGGAATAEMMAPMPRG